MKRLITISQAQEKSNNIHRFKFNVISVEKFSGYTECFNKEVLNEF